jgi:RNA-directed DNA polymerase
VAERRGDGGRINRKLVGWANYFCFGPVGPSYRTIDIYTSHRLRRWLCKKHKVRNTGNVRFSYGYLYEKLGLIELTRRPRHRPWGDRLMSCPRA